MSLSPLTVKVFLEHANGSIEIRRFSINTGNDDLYNDTKEKIMQLYPVLAHGSFALHWQDSDGDRVAFSSSEELEEALAYASNSVLHVYISEPKENTEKSEDDQQQQEPSDRQQLKSPDSELSQDESLSQGPTALSDQAQSTFRKPIHVGIICDGCKETIIGFRYICCVCPNYNLCQDCECDAPHAEHDMLRITHPADCPVHHQSFSNAYFMLGMHPGAYTNASGTQVGRCGPQANSDQFHDAFSNEHIFRPIDVICDGCKDPVAALHYKCCVCPKYNLCRFCKRMNLHAEHNMMITYLPDSATAYLNNYCAPTRPSYFLPPLYSPPTPNPLSYSFPPLYSLPTPNVTHFKQGNGEAPGQFGSASASSHNMDKQNYRTNLFDVGYQQSLEQMQAMDLTDRFGPNGSRGLY